MCSRNRNWRRAESIRGVKAMKSCARADPDQTQIVSLLVTQASGYCSKLDSFNREGMLGTMNQPHYSFSSAARDIVYISFRSRMDMVHFGQLCVHHEQKAPAAMPGAPGLPALALPERPPTQTIDTYSFARWPDSALRLQQRPRAA